MLFTNRIHIRYGEKLIINRNLFDIYRQKYYKCKKYTYAEYVLIRQHFALKWTAIKRDKTVLRHKKGAASAAPDCL